MSARRRKVPAAAPGLNVQERNLIIRIVVLSSLLLAIALVGMHTLLAGLAAESPRWLSGMRTGLGLLIFWLFVTASMRTLDQFAPRLNAIWAVVAGVGVAVIGMLLFLSGLRFMATLQDSTAILPRYNIIWFYALGGLLASLISLIHLRIDDRRWGYALEILLVIVGMALFFWLLT